VIALEKGVVRWRRAWLRWRRALVCCAKGVRGCARGQRVRVRKGRDCVGDGAWFVVLKKEGVVASDMIV